MIWGIPIINLAAAVTIVNTVMTLVVSGVMFLMRREFVSQKDHSQIRARVSKLETAAKIEAATTPGKTDHLELLAIRASAAVFEEKISGLATTAHISEIKVALASHDGERKALAQKVDGLAQLLEQIRGPIQTIYKHLLDGGKA